MTQQPRRTNTKLALIEAAERLFAEKGLSGVSAREITRAAGARNESALHYHFGGMEELIRHVFHNRHLHIERVRMERIAKLRSDGRADDISAILEAAIAPFIEACLDANGRLYSRFAVQLSTDPRFDIYELVRTGELASANDMRDLLTPLLSHLPAEVLTTRLRRAFTITVIIASDYVAQLEAGSAPSTDDAIAEAVSSVAGYISAPAHCNTRLAPAVAS